MKEIAKRDGLETTSGREIKVGKLKTASSKRDVPLNQAAVDAILDLRKERYLGEDRPLIPDKNGNYTRPVNFRKRYYRILEAAGIERKGLHSLRHTFATVALQNGIDVKDGKQYAGPLRRRLHPPHLHPRHQAATEPSSGNYGKFYGTGYVGQKKRKKARQEGLPACLALLTHFQNNYTVPFTENKNIKAYMYCIHCYDCILRYVSNCSSIISRRL